MKYTKQAVSIPDQVNKLKGQGLRFQDKNYGRKVLSRISYYRLRAYTYPFQDNEDPNHPFIKDVDFETIISLYRFDQKLRVLVFDAMADNGSPTPVFETNEQSTHVLVTLPIHTKYGNNSDAANQVANGANVLSFSSIQDIIDFDNGVTNQVNVQVNVQVSVEVSVEVNNVLKEHFGNYVKEILAMLTENPLSSTDILLNIGLTKHSKNKNKYIDHLLEIAWVNYTIPENPKDRNQKYKITESGVRLLKLLGEK